MERPSGALLTTSILTIVINPVLLLIAVILAVTFGSGEPAPGEWGIASSVLELEAYTGLLLFTILGLPLIILLLTLLAGVLGIVSRKKPNRALACLVIGVLLIFFIFVFFALIVITLGNSFLSFALFFCVLNLIVPVCYIKSAYVFRFKKRPQYVPPPPGYKFDAASNLYYVSEMINDPVTGTTVQRVTWFDPITGVYKQIDYPL